MYHYTGSGLSSVWLKNGYEKRETKYGSAVAIHDIRGLHRAIAASILEHSPALTGEEFRFLRKELDLSQTAIGAVLGKTEQAVAIWEKKNKVPKEADVILRALVAEFLYGPVHFKEMIQRLSSLDREIVARKLAFSEAEDGWSACMAA